MSADPCWLNSHVAHAFDHGLYYIQLRFFIIVKADLTSLIQCVFDFYFYFYFSLLKKILISWLGEDTFTCFDLLRFDVIPPTQSSRENPPPSILLSPSPLICGCLAGTLRYQKLGRYLFLWRDEIDWWCFVVLCEIEYSLGFATTLSSNLSPSSSFTSRSPLSPLSSWLIRICVRV